MIASERTRARKLLDPETNLLAFLGATAASPAPAPTKYIACTTPLKTFSAEGELNPCLRAITRGLIVFVSSRGWPAACFQRAGYSAQLAAV